MGRTHRSDADIVTEIELYDEKNKMHPLPVTLARTITGWFVSEVMVSRPSRAPACTHAVKID